MFFSLNKFLTMILSQYKKISNKIFNLPFFNFVFVILCLSFVVVIPFAFLFVIFDVVSTPNPISEKSVVYQIIAAVFIAPILETLIFQSFIIYLFVDIFEEKSSIRRNASIFVSALIFVHLFSWDYALMTFLIGLVFAWAYLNYYERYGFTKAFWAITLVHALRNTVAVLSDFIF